MTALTEPEDRAAEFNALNPVGTPVHYWLTIQHGDPRTGRTASAALPHGQHHSRPVVLVAGDDGDLRTVLLTLVRPIRARVVEPCELCQHPKATHGIRYVALHGEHEWADPYGRLITDLRRPAPAPQPAAECDCRAGEVCMQCGPGFEQRPAAVEPYDPVPDPETRHAWAAEVTEPKRSPFARIRDAARRSAA